MCILEIVQQKFSVFTEVKSHDQTSHVINKQGIFGQ